MAGNMWFADSAPGNAEPATLLKCGGRKPSLGLSASTFSITAPTLAVDTLADRALIAPGTNPVLSSDRKTRAQQLGFVGNKGNPYFDGATILFDLPMPTSDSGSFSFSGWIFPDNMADGVLIRSPVILRGPVGNLPTFLYIGAPGVGATFSGGFTPDATDTSLPQQRSSVLFYGGSASTPGRQQNYYLYNSSVGANLSSAFLHLMIGIQTTGGVPQITVYVNDTPICSNHSMDTHTNGSPNDFTILYSQLQDGAKAAEPNGVFTPKLTGPNRWELGAGAYVDADVGGNPAIGSAIQCTVTEWWMAAGHYVDWTSSGNRNAFHTLDSTLSHYIPVNIGSRGQALGYLPTIYCTGDPGAFRINRANGKLLTMQGGGTDVTFVPHYGEIQNMVHDDRVPGGT